MMMITPSTMTMTIFPFQDAGLLSGFNSSAYQSKWSDLKARLESALSCVPKCAQEEEAKVNASAAGNDTDVGTWGEEEYVDTCRSGCVAQTRVWKSNFSAQISGNRKYLVKKWSLSHLFHLIRLDVL